MMGRPGQAGGGGDVMMAEDRQGLEDAVQQANAIGELLMLLHSITEL